VSGGLWICQTAVDAQSTVQCIWTCVLTATKNCQHSRGGLLIMPVRRSVWHRGWGDACNPLGGKSPGTSVRMHLVMFVCCLRVQAGQVRTRVVSVEVECREVGLFVRGFTIITLLRHNLAVQHCSNPPLPLFSIFLILSPFR